MKLTSLFGTSTSMIILSLTCMLPAQAALQARDIGSTGATNAFYDTTLNVTWLDMASGALTWDTANAWASGLNVGGVTGWRLPTMTVANPNTNISSNGTTDYGYNVPGSSSEMASLFYNTLGNKAYVNTSGAVQAGYGLTNAGGFQNLQPNGYWLGTEFAPNLSRPTAWYFNNGIGTQLAAYKSDSLYAMAVHAGDVMAPVPEPETYAMLLLGLGVVGAISCRRSRAHGSLANQVN
ncbi:PEP-CTERM sorting domain-containing protein [Rhodoferax sp.]|uniref:PEP-CTERM sorting domain-containing protein n=1 Tax=Rhodoferax sp. TaxID=50421 RepID=UPI002622928D|nr:PEP-CTERM sorting domain-containing protein [Rhodoferax sp.]MDD5480014.1 PEP-CTERM sorting domain-containing protein [Rhodoferax sp.]